MANMAKLSTMAKLAVVFLLLQFPLLVSSSSSLDDDAAALLRFKSLADVSNRLSTWNSNTNTTASSLCSTWYGVSCLHNTTLVSKLVLENLNLSGPSLFALTPLSRLRVLSLSGNNLTSSIPDLSSLRSLRLLFLSENRLSGPIPDSITTLTRLSRLDLSRNELSGPVPVTLNGMTRLLTLRLEENNFEGEISGLDLRNLREFNVSGNPRLTGTVPESLARFPVSSFGGNLGLCGGPLRECDATAVREDPARPRSGAIASPVNDPARPGVVSSSSAVGSSGGGTGGARMSLVWIVAIIVADVVILVLISLMLYWYFWRRSHKGKENEGKRGRGELMMAAEKMVCSSSPYTNEGMTRGTTGFDRGRMVFFEENGRRFELEDLLRASAEMLGKGGFGTAYKAVLDDGFVVAVKRMKEAQGGGGGGRREFEQQMEVLGRLRHQNVVALKAYYFARDEKLLVFDYMPNGSLFWLLHGNRGPGRTPLDWTTRLKIAAGAARGVAFLHNSTKSPKLIHGNIKSSNVLIDKAGNARVSDFGLSAFVPATASTRNNGYRAPETLDGRKLTQSADVYSFGVLLLELLTGKCPSSLDGGGPYGVTVSGAIDLPRWVQSVVREEWTAEVFDLELMRYKDIEEEMVGLLQIAMACASPSPDQRPKMNQVIKLIDEIRGAEVSPSHDNTTFDSDSPSVSEDTCGVSQ
ncbi:hypothetical protein Droror1_Dr00022427 [Drosera rotundifolia]